MRKSIRLIIVLIFSFTSAVAFAAKATGKKPEIIVTNSDSELYVSDAAFFPSDSQQAVVFVPGFIFNKESWFNLAKSLQKKGVASLSISGKSVPNVTAGIHFLRDKGFKEICLVGGSSGAAAILNTISSKVESVTKVVILSPVRGTPLSDKNIKKLFIVSEDEKLFQTVQKFYDGSSEPKSIKIFEGKKHAQFLFYSPHKDEVTQLIVNFIVEE
jgi:hypothetical protein